MFGRYGGTGVVTWQIDTKKMIVPERSPAARRRNGNNLSGSGKLSRRPIFLLQRRSLPPIRMTAEMRFRAEAKNRIGWTTRGNC
jgi:hypothetical protein